MSRCLGLRGWVALYSAAAGPQLGACKAANLLSSPLACLRGSPAWKQVRADMVYLAEEPTLGCRLSPSPPRLQL